MGKRLHTLGQCLHFPSKLSGPALSMSGPGAPRRSLCRAPALSVSALANLSQSMSGLGALSLVSEPGSACCVGGTVSGPGALSLSVSGPSALCEGLRRSAALSVRALCVGARRSVWGLAPSQRSLCRPGALLLSVSGPDALPPLSASGPALCRAPAYSMSDPGALCVGHRILCVGPWPFPGHLCAQAPSFDPRATYPVLQDARATYPGPAPSSDPSGARAPSSDPQPPAQIRVPPIHPGAFLFSRKEPQTLLFGGTYICVYIYLYIYMYILPFLYSCYGNSGPHKLPCEASPAGSRHSGGGAREEKSLLQLGRVGAIQAVTST